MIKGSDKVIETEFNKPLLMTEENNENFRNSTKWWICKYV